MNAPAPIPADTLADRDPDGLFFLPLGGSGEIGMNLNLYAYRGQWLILDCGVTFGEEEHQPGVDVIMADALPCSCVNIAAVTVTVCG